MFRKFDVRGVGEMNWGVKTQNGWSIIETKVNANKGVLTLSFSTVFFRRGSQVSTIGGMARSHELSMGEEGYVIATGTIQEVGDAVEKTIQHVASVLGLGKMRKHCNGSMWTDL